MVTTTVVVCNVISVSEQIHSLELGSGLHVQKRNWKSTASARGDRSWAASSTTSVELIGTAETETTASAIATTRRMLKTIVMEVRWY